MPASKRPASYARKTFGIRLREARWERDLTLEDVAEKADMNWSYIAQVERGERNVSIDNLAALADAVGVALPDLLQPFPAGTDDQKTQAVSKKKKQTNG
ncbi:helix-turn-helix domain-containing protein [Deinococcus antarcticus]|uniref:Helix-turn-helix domain-containing protein n=1 Tax=Deinococcus antarcticus TaxID=1298767 RepID=A0ABV8A9N6_9DEIO